MYAEGHTVKDAKKLPLNLLDALRALDRSSVLRSGFGEDVVASYIKLRQAEWNEYASQLTDWERQRRWIADVVLGLVHAIAASAAWSKLSWIP